MLTILTSALDDRPFRGWVLYDGTCRWCRWGADRLRGVLGRRGFHMLALQSPLGQRFHAGTADEMKVVTVHGRMLGGADAAVYLARFIWWTWPLHVLAHVPGMPALLRMAYRFIAAHRPCSDGACALRDMRPPEGTDSPAPRRHLHHAARRRWWPPRVAR